VLAPEKLAGGRRKRTSNHRGASWPKSQNASLNIPAAVGWGKSSL
jgi:hypothetical protein